MRTLSHVSCAATAALTVSTTTSAADLRAVFTEIPGSPSSVIPGARDAAGQPIVARWTAINDMAVHVQGDQWVLRGFSDLSADLSNSFVLGAGTTGAMLMQEGQPVEGGGGGAGEVWDFFIDSPPAAFNAAGLMGYSARARGGTTSADDEKIGSFNGTTHTILLTQGSPLLGLQSIPKQSQFCTSPTIGNSVSSVHMLDIGGGTIAFGNTPITGCHSALYPALFHGNTAVMQNGVTPILVNKAGEEFVDSFNSAAAAFSPDGLHYAVPVTTNNPDETADELLLIDNTATLREGSTIPASAIVIDEVFSVGVIYGPNGDLYVRGDDPSANDWAVRFPAGSPFAPELVAATGMPITTGNTELWGNTIIRFVGNSAGDFIIAGNTSNPNASLDTVIVLNATEGGRGLLVREGDAVDVNGDGQYNDDAFVNTISGGNLTDSNVLYFRGTLRNGAGTSLGDVFIRADLGQPDCIGDTNNSGAVDVDDLIAVILGWGACGKPPAACPGDVNGSGAVDVDDLIAVILHWGPCQ